MPAVTVGASATNVLGFLEILDLLKSKTVNFVPAKVDDPATEGVDETAAASATFTTGGATYTITGDGLTVNAGKLTGGTITGFSTDATSGYTVSGLMLSVADMNAAFAASAKIGETLDGLDWTITGNGLANTSSDGTLQLSGTNVWRLLGANDKVTGGDGADTMSGGLGADSINGGSGNDKLYGYESTTTVGEDSSADTLIGANGNDFAYGGLGDDTLNGGLGTNELDGGDGDDTFIVSTTGGVNSFIGDTGDDEIVVDANTSLSLSRFSSIEKLTVEAGNNVTLNGTDGADVGNLADGTLTLGLTATGVSTFNWGAGADRITTGSDAEVHYGGLGNDTLTGGSGNDKLYGGSDADELNGGLGLDRLYGGNGVDEIKGGADADILYGGSGADSVNGEGGADTLYGDSGNDILKGGSENDVLNGGASFELGANSLYGGDGADTFQVTSTTSRDFFYGGIEGGGDSSAHDVVQILVSRSIVYDRLSGIENLTVASGKSVTITGTIGDDTVVFGTHIKYDFNSGVKAFTWGSGDDTITGRDDGNDTFLGAAGEDVLKGLGGDDVLRGGTGKDRLDGGDDNDTFLFKTVSEAGSGTNRDTIVKLEVGDTIDLEALNLDWVDTLGTEAGRQVAWDAENKLVLIDTDSDATAEYQIKIETVVGTMSEDRFDL